jgi:hypothetical protein
MGSFFKIPLIQEFRTGQEMTNWNIRQEPKQKEDKTIKIIK